MVVLELLVQKGPLVLRVLPVYLVELDLLGHKVHLVTLGEMVKTVLRESDIQEPQDTQAHPDMQVLRVLQALPVPKVLRVPQALKD